MADVPIVRKVKRPPVCVVEGCGRRHHCLGYCQRHYSRVRRHGDPSVSKWRSPGDVFTGHNGYVYVRQSDHPNADVNGNVAQHTLVMTGVLGRSLTKGESVHHKNGIRTDNRPENLELWVKSQPAGQRVADLVAFARGILERYGEEF